MRAAADSDQPIDPVAWIVPTLGEEPIAALVAAFYRQVPGDDLLAPMYPAADLDGAEERLRDFLVQRFGGSARYSERRGHPRLRMRHVNFAVDRPARDRWVALMDRALDDSAMPAQAKAAIRAFVGEVATFLVNR